MPSLCLPLARQSNDVSVSVCRNTGNWKHQICVKVTSDCSVETTLNNCGALWIPILHSSVNCTVRTDTVFLTTRNMFSHMNYCRKIIKSFRDQNVHAVVCVAVLHSNWISIPGLASTALSIILVSSSCVSEDLNKQLHTWLRSGDRFNKAFRKPSFTNA